MTNLKFKAIIKVLSGVRHIQHIIPSLSWSKPPVRWSWPLSLITCRLCICFLLRHLWRFFHWPDDEGNLNYWRYESRRFSVAQCLTLNAIVGFDTHSGEFCSNYFDLPTLVERKIGVCGDSRHSI